MNEAMDLSQAIQIAASAHAGQVDKRGETYILHPLRVMFHLTSEQDRIVGVLHDVIEDSKITIDDLHAQGLSKELCDDLDTLSKRKGETYTSYILRCVSRERCRRVKLADINDNLSRIDTLPADIKSRLSAKYELAKRLLQSI